MDRLFDHKKGKNKCRLQSEGYPKENQGNFNLAKHSQLLPTQYSLCPFLTPDFPEFGLSEGLG